MLEQVFAIIADRYNWKQMTNHCYYYPTDAKSQVYHYFHAKCKDELHSLMTQAQSSTSQTCFATSTELNHPHSLHILLSNIHWDIKR